MNNEDFPPYNQLPLIGREAYVEFNDVLDYVWKAPNLLDHEREIERDKLGAYFPIRVDDEEEEIQRTLELRLLRHTVHERRFEGTFRPLISRTSLFAVLSLYEWYILRICVAIEERASVRLDSATGAGLSRLLGFLRSAGFARRRYDSQLRAASDIRNCLVHANGLLRWTDSETRIRQSLSQRAHLSPHRLQYALDHPDETEALVSIESSHLGDLLKIENSYSYMVAGLARDSLCWTAIDASKRYGI